MNTRMMPRGGKRKVHERTIPMEGMRLRRILPSGVAFLAVWCIGWNAAAFSFPKIMDAPAGSPESRLDGGVGSFVFDAVFPLIGIAMTVYCIWLLWKHLRPSYEVREDFEYYFRGTVVFKSGLSVASSYRIPLK